MREIIAVKGKPLAIGYEGENEAVRLVFPIAVEWQKLYGDGTFTILMQRPTEDASYPKVTTVDGNKVCCVIDSADVSILGMGAVIVRYMVGDTIAKSEIYSTRIRGSIGAEGDVPEPYQAWVDEVLNASAEVGEAVERAESARDEAVSAKEASDGNRAITAQLADIARLSASGAERSADDAEQSADSAEASARDAEQSAEEARQTVQNKLTPIHLYYDDTLNVIKDKDGNTLNYQQIYALTTQGNTQVTVNYSDFIYRLVGYYGNAIEFTNAYLYEGREWSGRIIINSDNAVRFDEVPNVHDVRINGTSITEGGVADIPMASGSQHGVIKLIDSYGSYGINTLPNGTAFTVGATKNDIDNRTQPYRGVTPSNLPYAVKSAMSAPVSATDPAWSEAEQLAARERIGIDEFEKIATITLTEDTNAISVELSRMPREVYISFKATISANDGINVRIGTQRIAYLYNGAITTFVREGFAHSIIEKNIVRSVSASGSNTQAMNGNYNCFHRLTNTLMNNSLLIDTSNIANLLKKDSVFEVYIK